VRGVVQQLRDIVPLRPLTLPDAMRVAEAQANRLLQILEITGPPFPESAIADLPRIEVTRMQPAPVSGAAHWARGRWLIMLNGAEPRRRQRYSLAHEFKHILDSPFTKIIYPHDSDLLTHLRVEQICDVFAACLLMPRAWLEGYVHTKETPAVRQLARRFDVSPMAMRVRLRQLGFNDSAQLTLVRSP
jgi:hypothetical protein